MGGGVVGGDDDDEAPLALTDEVKSYEEAFRLYRNDEYPAAIDRFKAFLQTYPSSDYADNALFWLGECHFKIGEHEQAVLAFDDVAKRYPEGNKVPDALYRQGIALLEIGKQTDQEATYRGAARQIFERLINNYPDSDRVPEARRQLEKLGQ
jgi:tol-pal system protein YbgF